MMSSDAPEVTAIADAAAIGLPVRRPEISFLIMIYGEHLGRRFEIGADPVTVGRSADCGIRLTDDCVSRRHCRMVPSPEGTVLMDLGSTNGTYVNGTGVSARHLRDGDTFQVGRSIFKFLSGDNIEHAYHEEIYRLKTTDGLTGAYNKRYFDETINREVFRYLRHGRPLSLIMGDIDHFKRVNDQWGHLAGDRVLSQIGEVLASQVNAEDTLCRYGGEEFTVLLPETPLSEAMARAERMRELIEEARFEFDGHEIPVTMSFGVAAADTALEGPESFVALADERLYAAKRGGRNRVEPGPA